MARYDAVEGSVATAHLSDTRGHGYGSSLAPLAIPDRRPSQIGFTALSEEHRRIYATQIEEYARAGPHARGGVGDEGGGGSNGVDPWMYRDQDVNTFWTGPTGASTSPPDGSLVTNTNKDNVTVAGASGSASRVASNTPGGSTPSSSSTTANPANPSPQPSSGTYTPRAAYQFAANGGASSPLSHSQIYDFSSLELPLLQPPPTSVIPLAPVSHPTLPPQSRGDTASYPSALPQSPVHNKSTSRNTLWWGELEPWMDEEYAKQVCSLMGWDAVTVKIPHTPTDLVVTGQQPNNPGYCFLTFPTSQQAAAVFSQINRSPNDTPVNMPNSTKPFVLNWASSPTPSPATATFSAAATAVSQALPNQQKEYSIFVGDLAPETSNSDLVAVFRNPVLGLRNDRAPKFIRPFYSCKSAKIMLDPVTGVSRGYGFVRFTDEADQQRALIEMHGLYCLSRPMRISPATAKFKTPQSGPDNGFSGVTASSSGSSIGSSSSLPSMSTSTTASSVSSNFQPNGAPSITSLDTLAQLIATSSDNPKQGGRPVPSITAPLVADKQMLDESWKHQAQARAILGNLIGPNGEQLTSTDPYNTTVFVGGLSPLISEETLRTFFAPFGDIHYVKVPTGKHCGFVQFVRKADAERAIERMQGFPIGGSRIRLSWGRSQYKAAQAAAQAAAHAHVQALHGSYNPSLQLTQEQAVEMLIGYGFSGGNGQVGSYSGSTIDDGKIAASVMKSDEERLGTLNGYSDGYVGNGGYAYDNQMHSVSGFSPFSPDPNYLAGLVAERETAASPRYAAAPGSDRFTSEKIMAGESGRTSTQGYQSDDTFGFALGKPQHLHLHRVAARNMDGSCSRPASSQATSGEKEHSAINDFHGTVAALDLDGNRSPGLEGGGSSALSFRMNLGSSPRA